MLHRLLAEAERKDTVFLAELDTKQNQSFLPFGIGKALLMPQIKQIAASIENSELTLEEGHQQVMQIMELYYKRPYPLSRYTNNGQLDRQ